jgi:hypothetical protein
MTLKRTMKQQPQPQPNDYVIILGHPCLKTELFYMGTFALVAISVLVGSGFYVLNDSHIQNQQAAEARASAKPDLSPLDEALHLHLATTSYGSINSIRAVGSYSSTHNTLEFTLLAKKPHYYRQTLVDATFEVRAGYDGDSLWLEQTHEVVDQGDPALLYLNKAAAIMECAIPALAWEYTKSQDPNNLSRGDLHRVNDAQWAGEKCMVIKNDGLLESPVFHYINASTGLEVYRRASITIAEGRTKEIGIVYSEPVADSSYMLPSGYELRIDGVLFSTAHFDRVEVNQGLHTYLFEPSAVTKQHLAEPKSPDTEQ